MTSEQRSAGQEAGARACVRGGREGARGGRGAGGVSDEGGGSGVHRAFFRLWWEPLKACEQERSLYCFLFWKKKKSLLFVEK